MNWRTKAENMLEALGESLIQNPLKIIITVLLLSLFSILNIQNTPLQNGESEYIQLTLLSATIVLFFLFRRISAVLIITFIVVLSLLTTLGTMTISNTPLTIPTQILPSFLLIIGIGAVIHLLAIFFQHFNENGEKNKAISFALKHSGLAIIMTSITIIIALLSFSTTSIAPMTNLGIYGALGVFIILLNTLLFLPAILTLLPIKQAKAKHMKKSKKMDTILLAMADFSYNHARYIVGFSIFIILLWAYFASFAEFKDDPLSLAISTITSSYLITFLLVAILMVLLLGNLKTGLVSMLPNLLPIVFIVGFMALLDIHIDIFTILLGAIVIGLSIDDTLHLFHNFATFRHRGFHVKQSIENTMMGTGRALIAIPVILSLSFYLYEGILTSGAMAIAFFSNIILGPALLTLITKDTQ